MIQNIFNRTIILVLISLKINAQQFTVIQLANMPKRVTNNAIVGATVNGVPYVYSFGGLDSTKLFSGITLNSFRYNTQTDAWSQIGNLPDTLGKIASAASAVKNKIYIIGGYHVLSNGNEISSNKVHVYSPENNAFETDAVNIPIPIDDHVQSVWRDSLIYVITGWSNTTNVPNVQIFNPATNNWLSGTSVPNNTIYKTFGAAGVIIGDTIYYYGGASTAVNFPAQNKLRMGIISPTNPINITWSSPSFYQTEYRCAATSDSMGNVYFLGGSAVSYNYNGIAYNGNGGVNPNLNYFYFNKSNPVSWNILSAQLPMDLRGIANISATTKFIVGGMEPGQIVSNKTLKLQLNVISNIVEKSLDEDAIIITNNSEKNFIEFDLKEKENQIVRVEGFTIAGKCVLKEGSSSSKFVFDTSKFSKGQYIFVVTSKNGIFRKKISIY